MNVVSLHIKFTYSVSIAPEGILKVNGEDEMNWQLMGPPSSSGLGTFAVTDNKIDGKLIEINARRTLSSKNQSIKSFKRTW